MISTSCLDLDPRPPLFALFVPPRKYNSPFLPFGRAGRGERASCERVSCLIHLKRARGARKLGKRRKKKCLFVLFQPSSSFLLFDRGCTQIELAGALLRSSAKREGGVQPKKRRRRRIDDALRRCAPETFSTHLSLSLSSLFSTSPLLQLFHDHTKRLADRDSLKLTQEEYDRPPLVAILQVALACLCCAWASVCAAGPLRRLAPAANQAPLAGTPFRGAAWMTLGHRGMAAPARVAVVKPEGGRSF